MPDVILNGLLPELSKIGAAHKSACLNKGVRFTFIQGYRTKEQQMFYYMKGRARNHDGSWYVVSQKDVVTNALPEKDPHCRRAAYDIAILGPDGKIDWLDKEKYAIAGDEGKKLGLVWGGDFKSLHGDLGHFELKNWRELRPTLMTRILCLLGLQ